jgi:hypothetical protein
MRRSTVSAATPTQAFSLVSTFDHVDDASPVRGRRCPESCVFAAAAQWHHARLLAVESDQDAVLELFELALTWHELEYSETQVVHPEQWMAFMENHVWADPDRIERIFSIATDVAMTAERAARKRQTVTPGAAAS